MNPFLSIVVPFHNSAEKCRPLLMVLTELRPEDAVELIFVDDGSTDRTLDGLRDFKAASRCQVTIVERENGGPGAAKNSGLDQASGQWVWFVDSDDVIDLKAITIAKDAGWPRTDIIAWEIHHPHPGVACSLPSGLHEIDEDAAPPTGLQTLPAKWFSMDFLRRTGLRFPEYCVFEDVPIGEFVLPLLVTSYFKSDFRAYEAIAGPSVTRGASGNPRFFDRLRTIALGRAYLEGAKLSPAARWEFDKAFVRLFLWYSIALSRRPGASWVTAARVMRQYREEAARFGITIDPFDTYPGRPHSGLVARLLWLLAALLPSQKRYFHELRQRAWGREIEWTVPLMPGHWTKG